MFATPCPAIALVLFGLSMDYQIFVVSRILDAIRQGVPPTLAVSTGITNSAGVITSAAGRVTGTLTR